MKTGSSVHVVYINCFFVFVFTFKTIFVHNMFWACCFHYRTGKSMNNLLSYCGLLVDARIRASNKDLPVQPVKMNCLWIKCLWPVKLQRKTKRKCKLHHERALIYTDFSWKVPDGISMWVQLVSWNTFWPSIFFFICFNKFELLGIDLSSKFYW